MDRESLNQSQLKAVKYNGKHLLVLAGAGTGKTHTIVSRAAYLIENGVDATQIQILSFTRKSAREIVSRVNTMFDGSVNAKKLNGATFHSWCMDIIKSNPNVFSFSDYSVIDRDDQVETFKLICGRNIKVIEKTRLTPARLLEIYSFARNTRKNISETLKTIIFNNRIDDEIKSEIEKLLPYIKEVFISYQTRKRDRKYMDYDDILDIVASGLSKNEQARQYISKQYRHILVDEMQDTNPLQWELLNCFRDNCNLFCVGDDAQSIYAFRGADFRNIHLWNERVPNSEIYKLEDNYRSTQEILNVSNWLLEQSEINYNKRLLATRGSGIIPAVVNFTSEYDEAEWVVSNILENVTNDNKEYKEHLILTRSAYYCRILELELLAQKVPYVFLGGTTLLKSKHIRDLLSALRIIENIYDEIAWIRYLQLWDKVGLVTATKYVDSFLENKDINECISYLEDKNVADKSMYLTLGKIKTKRNNPSEAIMVALEQMDSMFEKQFKEQWISRKQDFKLLSMLAKKHSSISEFIAEYILDPQLEELSVSGCNERDCVTLSTIHSAKGLEADVCYVLNVSAGSYPSPLCIYNGMQEIEEERRVLYVALTRAKNELYITRNITAIDKADFRVNTSKFMPDKNEIIENYFLSGINNDLYIEVLPESTKNNIKRFAYLGEKIETIDLGINLD